MGGDNSPDKTINGVGLFLKKYNKNDDFILKLYGDKNKITEKLNKYKVSSNLIEIIHTDSVVSDKETPITAVKILKIQACGIP